MNKRAIKNLLWRSTYGLLLLLGVAALATRIALNLSWLFGAAPPTDPGELHYAENPGTAFAHTLPALLFLLSGTAQLGGPRPDKAGRHRWMGMLFVASALPLALSSVVMNHHFSRDMGGMLKISCVDFMAGFLLLAIALALRALMRKDFASHGRWMTLAFATGFAVPVQRFIIGIVFGILGEIPPHPVIGGLMWIGLFLSWAFLLARPQTAEQPPLDTKKVAPFSRNKSIISDF